MNKEEIKKAMEERVVELKERIAELKEKIVPIEPDKALGRLTRLDVMQLNAVSEAGLENCINELEALEQKLETIDDPNFGRCQMCGGIINIERIKAMPESDICINCAQYR